MMRVVLAALMIAGTAALALAQTGSGSGSGSSTSGPTSPGAAPRGTAPLTAPSPSPSTPSQRNLDIAPPTRNLPESQGNAVTPQPPPRGTSTATVPPQDKQNPSSTGGVDTNARTEPGGANSSVQSRQNKTGKNALSESYTSCLNIWDGGTHMSRGEWARACKRVENRLQTLQEQALEANAKQRRPRLSEKQ